VSIKIFLISFINYLYSTGLNKILQALMRLIIHYTVDIIAELCYRFRQALLHALKEVVYTVGYTDMLFNC